MSEVRQQLLIEAPPRAVWALITDVNRHPEWWPDVEQVHCDDFHEGCSYREVMKVPLGTAEREVRRQRGKRLPALSDRLRDQRGLRRSRPHRGQGDTFVDGAAGMNPIGLRYSAFDAIAGRSYFRKWLARSLEAMNEAATRPSYRPPGPGA